jgi:hypothetical protein
MENLHTKMKAITTKEAGGPEVLEVGEVEVPKL